MGGRNISLPDSTSARTAALDTPTAAGEYVFGIVPFRHMFEARSVDIAMLDVMRTGGISGWLKIAAMAEAFNLSARNATTSIGSPARSKLGTLGKSVYRSTDRPPSAAIAVIAEPDSGAKAAAVTLRVTG